MIPVFDGHNDFLLRLLRDPARREAIWLTGEGKGHLDLPRMKAGVFVGGFFAVYIPSPEVEGAPDTEAIMDAPPYDLPLPALRAALRHLEALAGRTRSEDRFAPRTLDLDVIALSGPRGDEHLDHAETDVAHVVVPWADVEPDRRLRDGGRTLAERAAPLRDRLSAFTPS